MLKNTPKSKWQTLKPSLVAIGVGTILSLCCVNDVHKRSTLTYDNIKTIQGAEIVSQNSSNKPDVIILLQNHLVHGEKDEGIYTRGSRSDSIKSISQICDKLYNEYGVRTLLPEGLDPSFKEMYEKTGKVKLAQYNPKDSTGYIQSLENLINNKKWKLEFAEDYKNRDDIAQVLAPVYKIHDKYLKQTSKDITRIETEMSENKQDFLREMSVKNRIKGIVEKTNSQIKEEVDRYFTPEKTALLYQVIIDNRDQKYAEACIRAKAENKTPMILMIGAAHKDTLPSKLKNLNYVIIKPEGITDAKPVTPESLKERYYLKLSVN